MYSRYACRLHTQCLLRVYVHTVTDKVIDGTVRVPKSYAFMGLLEDLYQCKSPQTIWPHLQTDCFTAIETISQPVECPPRNPSTYYRTDLMDTNACNVSQVVLLHLICGYIIKTGVRASLPEGRMPQLFDRMKRCNDHFYLANHVASRAVIVYW